MLLLGAGGVPGGGAGPEPGARLAAAEGPPRVPEHPVAVDVTKAGYTVRAAMKSALEDGSIRDVTRMIAETEPEEDFGVFPDLQDPWLWVSYPVCVRRFLEAHPAGRELLRAEYGALADLRVRTAIDDQDQDAAAAASVQFWGTAAAVRAGTWLGDRALGVGDFARAAGCYRRAHGPGAAAESAALEQRLSLVAALRGQDVRAADTGPFAYGAVQLAPEAFARLLAEVQGPLRVRTQPWGGIFARDVPAAPPPGPWLAKHRGSIETPVVSRSGRQAAEPDADWAARVITGVTTDDHVLLTNGWQMKAVFRESGKRLWDQSTADGRAGTPRGAWTPTWPLLVDDRLFVRRLSARAAPALVCLDARTGSIRWSTPAHLYVATDPLPQGPTIRTLTIEASRPFEETRTPLTLGHGRWTKKTPRELLLQWTSWDAAEGTLLSQRPLVRWRADVAPLPVGRAAVCDDRLVVSLDGVTLCTDLDGRLQWVRNQAWTPLEDSPRPRPQFDSAPLIAAERVVVAPPGTARVVCLDLDTGALLWEHDTAVPRRLIGLAEQRVVLQAGTELRTLALADGADGWSRPFAAAWDAIGCGGPGGLMYAEPEPAASDAPRAAWVWLNPADGQVTARWPIDAALLAAPRAAVPALGPLIQAGAALLVGRERTTYDRKERDLYELLPVAPPAP